VSGRAACEVESNCLNYGHCPYCMWGSQYRPRVKGIRFPLDELLAKERVTARQVHEESAAYKRGRSSNTKGKRLERELARLVHGERVPLSGELENYPNDVISAGAWRLECKGRSNGLGLLYRWLGGADILALNDGQGWLFTSRLAEYVQALWEPCHLKGSLDTVMDSQPDGDTTYEGRVFRVRRVPGGLDQARAWITAEKADALCFKADRRDWLLICDGPRMAAVLAAMEPGQRPTHALSGGFS